MLRKHRRTGQPYLQTMRDLSLPEDQASRSSVLVGPFKTQTDEPTGFQALTPTRRHSYHHTQSPNLTDVAYQPRTLQQHSQGAAGMLGSVINSQAWPGFPPASRSAFRPTVQRTDALHADQRSRALLLSQTQETLPVVVQTPPRIVMTLSPVSKDLNRHPVTSRYN